MMQKCCEKILVIYMSDMIENMIAFNLIKILGLVIVIIRPKLRIEQYLNKLIMI